MNNPPAASHHDSHRVQMAKPHYSAAGAVGQSRATKDGYRSAFVSLRPQRAQDVGRHYPQFAAAVLGHAPQDVQRLVAG